MAAVVRGPSRRVPRRQGGSLPVDRNPCASADSYPRPRRPSGRGLRGSRLAARVIPPPIPAPAAQCRASPLQSRLRQSPVRPSPARTTLRRRRHSTARPPWQARSARADTPLAGPIAQRLEQRTHNPLVHGSNPCGPTTKSLISRQFFAGFGGWPELPPRHGSPVAPLECSRCRSPPSVGLHPQDVAFSLPLVAMWKVHGPRGEDVQRERKGKRMPKKVDRIDDALLLANGVWDLDPTLPISSDAPLLPAGVSPVASIVSVVSPCTPESWPHPFEQFYPVR